MLSAYQGYLNARFNLAYDYTISGNRKRVRGDEGWRKDLMLALYWNGKAVEVDKKIGDELSPSFKTPRFFHEMMTIFWHRRKNIDSTNVCLVDLLPGHSHIPLCTRIAAKGGFSFNNPWANCCAICGCQEKAKLQSCGRCKSFSYCSKKCQVEHWKLGHKLECKGGSHWLESFFHTVLIKKNTKD